jgi:hypothetical protein
MSLRKRRGVALTRVKPDAVRLAAERHSGADGRRPLARQSSGAQGQLHVECRTLPHGRLQSASNSRVFSIAIRGPLTTCLSLDDPTLWHSQNDKGPLLSGAPLD